MNDKCYDDISCDYDSRHKWSHISDQKGMFAFTGLTEDMISEFRSTNSIYMPSDGRISIASINPSNIEYIVEAIHEVSKGKQIWQF